MSKERLKLKEFRNYIDFLDDSQDMQDYGRFIDTLQSLYEDGWFDWLYLYAKEQSERVQELEEIIYQDERQAVLEGMYEQNKRYREAREIIEQVYKENYVRNSYGYEDGYLDGLDTAMSIIDKALEE